MRAWKRRTHSGTLTASSASDHSSAATTGCCNGHGASAGSAVEQSLEVAARTGLDEEGQFELLNLVDDYVFGQPMRGTAMRAALSGDRDEFDAVAAWVEAQLETGEYPQLLRIAGGDVRPGLERYVRMASDEHRFERGLERLLDGIALDLARRGLG